MGKVEDYLDRKGFAYARGGDELTLNCPFCRDTERKFNVNAATGLWRCWHSNRCGKSGTFWQLQKDLGDEPESLSDQVKPLRKSYSAPAGNSVRPLGNALLTWLSKRKLTPETARRFSLQQTSDEELVFPYFHAGRLVNRKYRKLPKAFRQEKGAMPCLFGRDLVAPDVDTLLITEGELDAMAFWQYGLEAVSVPSGAEDTRWVEEEWDYLKRFRRLLLALDNDEAGDKGTEAIVKRLGWRWEILRVRLPFKDANDCLLHGVTEDEVRFEIEKAEALRPAEVKLLADVIGHLGDKPEPGLPCELPGLTEKLGGWRPRELTIHGGEAASGKTTATCQEVLGLLQRGQRVCMVSLEMPLRVLVFIMAHQASLAPASFAWQFGQQLVFVDVPGSLEVGRLVELMEYAAQRYGCGHFVVDSLGCLTIELADYWLRQKEVVGRLVRFARDHSVHVHLVHHLRKPGKGSHAGQVDHADLEGSAWIRNLADTVLLYRRIRDADRERTPQLVGVDGLLYVDKNRHSGDEGVVMLSFDKERRRFGVPGKE